MNFEKVRYPDGQISAKLVSANDPSEIVSTRINSYEDLFYLRSIAEILQYKNIETSAFIPCLFGQRSDRRFIETQSFDLKVIAEVINSCHFTTVSVLDPHSDVCLALINNSFKLTSFNFVTNAVENIKSDNLVLVSPDAGAYKKVFTYGSKLDLPVVAANKYRSLSGEINMVFVGDVKDKDCLIVDDLCDGGYTFTVLSQKLKEQGARDVYLYVTHGYFSKGFDQLKENITRIFCTNSVKDISNDYHDGNHMKSLNNFVHQFKVV
jgi:ribose-phosphate pyrophosphokinase